MARPRIVLDAMGGDHAPHVNVAGAVSAVRRGICDVTLVGRVAELREEIDRAAAHDVPLVLVDAPDVIEMGESPLAALRRKPRASIVVALEIARAEGAAVISAGHTGATLIAAHGAFGVLPGVERAALAVTVPTRGGAAVLVDAGANVDCRPSHLVQFAIMGSAYARLAFGLETPRVGLLSIGEEAGKGNELVREAHGALARAPIAFIGNFDAREMFAGGVDVIVCDGFVGNIALKVGEGLVDWLGGRWRAEGGALGQGVLRGADDAEYGAAPLLGLKGLVLVAHGRSTAQAIENGLAGAARLADGHIVARLAAALAA